MGALAPCGLLRVERRGFAFLSRELRTLVQVPDVKKNNFRMHCAAPPAFQTPAICSVLHATRCDSAPRPWVKENWTLRSWKLKIKRNKKSRFFGELSWHRTE